MQFPSVPQTNPYNLNQSNNQQQPTASSLLQGIVSASQDAMQKQQEQQFLATIGNLMTGNQQQPQRAQFGQSWPMQAPSARTCYHCRATVQPGENHTARNCPVKKKEEEEAATLKAEKIVQERMARGEIVVKQELAVPQGCMRSLGAYSAGNGLTAPGTQPNFGASMTPGFSTPGSTAMVPMQPPPPPPQAAMQEQMQLLQQGLAAEMHDIKSSLQSTLKEEMGTMSGRVSSLLQQVEDVKASRVLMRGELNKFTTKYDELAKGVASIRTIESNVNTCMQSICKRVGALEAAPVPARRRNNAGQATSTPATAKKGKALGGGKPLSKKAKAALAAATAAAEAEAARKEAEEGEESDPDEDLYEDHSDEDVSVAELAARAIAAEGAAGALPQRRTPPRMAKDKKRSRVVDDDE